MLENPLLKFGFNLHINEQPINFLAELPVYIDCETDEHDNFVGIGLTQDGKEIYYLSRVSMSVAQGLENAKLVGHNIKSDAKWLVKWGFSIKSTNLFSDTILMSYVVNSTKDSHSLKDLGKELGYVWSTYRDMVGKGKLKTTLDKQPIEKVAEYCSKDVFVTYQLYQHFNQIMTPAQRNIYNNLEMPLMRILFEMELKGVLVDEEKLRSLDKQFRDKLDTLVSSLKGISGFQSLNPNSNKQIAQILKSRGFRLPKTPKGNEKVDKYTLEQYKSDSFVSTLIEYNKLEKLVSTYTGGLLSRPTLPRVYPTYNQLSRTSTGDDKGISTGRLSCSDPNLQQIPTRTEEGKFIRELFVSRPGYTLIDADYSQIEYRLLAHFTKEPVLLKAFKEGQDVHEATGKLLGCDRDTGKTLNFASIYGAGNKKIARTAKITEDAAADFLQNYWKLLPSVTSWINQVKYSAFHKGYITTLMGRNIPLPGIRSSDLYERFHWERCAVNFIIQGSAAEILKLAAINLRKIGYLPILTVHDEFLFECLLSDTTRQGEQIQKIMESVVKLDVPLVADIGVGQNWKEAKGD